MRIKIDFTPRSVLLASIAATLVIAALSGTVVAIRLAINIGAATMTRAWPNQNRAPSMGTRVRPQSSTPTVDRGEGSSVAAVLGEVGHSPDDGAERTPSTGVEKPQKNQVQQHAPVPSAAVPAVAEPKTPASHAQPPAEAETRAENVSAALPDVRGGFELPPARSSESKVLAAGFPADLGTVDLTLIGWRELTGNNLDCAKQVIGSRAEWTIMEMSAANTAAAAPRKPIGLFLTEQGRLSFRWGTANNSSLLRSCLLRLSVKRRDAHPTDEATIALRRTARLPAAAINFQDASAKIRLPLSESPDEIKAKPLRLAMTIADTENQGGVAKALLEPAGSVRANDLITATIAIGAPARAGRTYTISIEATLMARPGAIPEIVLKYWWKSPFDLWENGRSVAEPSRTALSIRKVEEYKRDVANSIVLNYRSALAAKRHELGALRKPKAREDYDARKRAELKSEITDLKAKIASLERAKKEKERGSSNKPKAKAEPDSAKRAGFEEEFSDLQARIDADLQRCDQILGVLNGLPNRIKLRVYYQFGQEGDQATQLTLAETVPE